MADRTKSGKKEKSKPDHEIGSRPDAEPDVGGLTASLEALVPGSTKNLGLETDMEPLDEREEEPANELENGPDEGASKSNREIIDLPSRDNKLRDERPRSVKKRAHKWDEAPANDDLDEAEKHQNRLDAGEPAREKASETLEVVELLGALKSDIDSLRKDNEVFKSQLMGSPLARNNVSKSKSDSDLEMRTLLEALQADIGSLREENELMRSRGFLAGEPVADEEADDRKEEDELYQMLGELKEDIVSLRTENEALRHGVARPSRAPARQKDDEVAQMLKELKGDINALKYDNEALRIENLTARDGAQFKNLGGQPDAYRNTDYNPLSGLLKGLGALVLAAGAAGGGYYLAKSQDPGVGLETKREKASVSGQNEFDRQVAPGSAPVVARPRVTATPETRSLQASVKSPKKPAIAARTPRNKMTAKATRPAKAAGPGSQVSDDVETAMMARADGLLKARDLGAARMVLVYLARHGSAGAMTRLAQTYDPQYLGEHRFDELKYGDMTRALRLYGAASGMGDQRAAARLKEMQ